MRSQIGKALPLDGLDAFADEVAAMLDGHERWRDRIKEVRAGFVFNLGHSAEVAGEFLLETVLAKQAVREVEGRQQAKEVFAR